MNNLEILKYCHILESQGFKKADIYKNSLLLKYIYKYVSLNDNDTENEKRFQTLENKYIWCSSCTSYNDPFEFNVLYFDEEKMHQEGYSDKQIEYIKNFYNQQKNFTCL